jgi:hypothetical protein
MTFGFDKKKPELSAAAIWKQTASLIAVVPLVLAHVKVVGSKETVPSTLVLDDGVDVILLPPFHEEWLISCFTPTAQASSGSAPEAGVASPATTTAFKALK